MRIKMIIKNMLFVLACILLAGCAPIIKQKTPVSIKTAQAELEYAFTQAGQHPEKKLLEIINGAKSSLDIAIYSLTKTDIVEALLAAHKRGVNIRIITDQEEARNKFQAKSLIRLVDTGIPVKVNIHKGLMHLKVTIADQVVVTTGSYNYTQAASTFNDEVLLAIHDPNLAQAWDTQFLNMWEDPTDFAPIE
jgi:phosphatidylserine/phosphatidylglycerophosphate/cardiolipin synthase-like enzyme